VCNIQFEITNKNVFKHNFFNVETKYTKQNAERTYLATILLGSDRLWEELDYVIILNWEKPIQVLSPDVFKF
jgi:hypothetical protein